MIELTELTKQFKAKRVLDGLSLAVAAGERIALIGSNGAGKTTLIRCLLGEYTYAGTIRVDGHDPRADRQQVLSRVGFVPQLPPPLKMPVGQLIRFAAETCGANPKDIEELCSQLGLDAALVRHQPFVKLSGGQKQKLLIAIALGRNARLLILDEPAANLDPAARQVFFDLLAQRVGDATMIISSHRLDEVAPLVTRVVELDLGRVTLDDRVEDSGGLDETLACRIVARRADEALAKALGRWNFSAEAGGTVWRGEIAGPDRLRFLGVLARYAGLLVDLSWETRREPPAEVRAHA